MKNIPIILLSLIGLLLFQSCQDCTITVLEEPELFDCPELSLNIGDACDDGNPETINDIVDTNCNCLGAPINACEGAILVMRAEVQNNALGNLFLDRADQAPLDFLNFLRLTPISGGSLQTSVAFPFQFSAINEVGNQYFYGFQYENAATSPLLLGSTDGAVSPSFLNTNFAYAAPVYHQGTLYAINVNFDMPNAAYEILNIDLNSGAPAALITGNVATNSQVVNPVFFSASNASNKVFFLAGTSLFEYDVNANAVTHVLLETEINPDFPVVYTGLEYRASTNQLLALRHQANGNEIQTDLVSISQDGNFTQSDLLSLNGYTFFQDSGVLHTTAYDSCADQYYITTPVALEQEAFESYLIQVDLSTAALEDRIFPGFLCGIEVEKE